MATNDYYVIWAARDSAQIKRAVLARDVGEDARPACSRLAGIAPECENFWGSFSWIRRSAVQDIAGLIDFEIVERV